MSQDIVQIKLKIDIPQDKWLAKFNKKYPELNFYILSKFLIDDKTGLTLYQINGPSVTRFISDFKESSTKISSQILFEGEELVLLNVKVVDPWILNTLVKTELLIIYPILVKEGKIRIKAITDRFKVDHFMTQLEKKGIKATIKSIGYYHKSALLTSRQNEILNTASKNGYFDIPRRISLSEFAKTLHISKSALSETMRRIYKKLTESYLQSSS
ncbi:MAG: helix-turn-helix domain-containing protein [Candidatus Lokiarchaeia archaeon]